MRLCKNQFALPVLWVSVALAVATAFADSPRKKCISFGWEYGRLTPEQLLANAEKFKGTVVDGVGIYLRATNRAGKAIGTYGFTRSQQDRPDGASERVVPEMLQRADEARSMDG